MFSLLHVDNNFFYKEILRDISLKQDFQFFSAKTPEKAYEVLEAHDIDIIITGLEFEGINGEEFIAALMKKKPKTTPVIVLSATVDDALKNRLFNLGISDYLTKDAFLSYITALIRKLQSGDAIATQLKKLRIAVLDDNEAHLGMMREILEQHQVCHVDYYLHPSALLTTHKAYNIYLIDCVLPDISGEQVITEIRARDEYAVIIAVSSLNSHAAISNILSAGADDYITKPFTANLFMARIKSSVRTYTLMEQLREKNMRLAQIVKEDGLTGLYNHKYIMELLDKEVERAQRYKAPLTILMIDIDRFKNVNDTFGHHVGDEVLARIGQHLKNDSRRIDISGRYGGEEFIIILPDTDLCGAIVYAERLRQDMEELRFHESDLTITISGGVAEYSGESPADLVRLADEFLYSAKNNGRNRIEY